MRQTAILLGLVIVLAGCRAPKAHDGSDGTNGPDGPNGRDAYLTGPGLQLTITSAGILAFKFFIYQKKWDRV